MTCDRFREQIVERLEQMLPPEDEAACRAHERICQACAAEWQAQAEIFARLQRDAARLRELPGTEAIMRGIARREARSFWRRARRSLVWSGAAAAFVAVVIAAWSLRPVAYASPAFSPHVLVAASDTPAGAPELATAASAGTVKFGDNSQIVMAPYSRVVLDSDTPYAEQVTLKRGAIVCHAVRPRGDILLKTDVGSVTAVGARTFVSYREAVRDAAGSLTEEDAALNAQRNGAASVMTVAVTTGRVGVDYEGQKQMLAAGANVEYTLEQRPAEASEQDVYMWFAAARSKVSAPLRIFDSVERLMELDSEQQGKFREMQEDLRMERARIVEQMERGFDVNYAQRAGDLLDEKQKESLCVIRASLGAYWAAVRQAERAYAEVWAKQTDKPPTYLPQDPVTLYLAVPNLTEAQRKQAQRAQHDYWRAALDARRKLSSAAAGDRSDANTATRSCVEAHGAIQAEFLERIRKELAGTPQQKTYDELAAVLVAKSKTYQDARAALVKAVQTHVSPEKLDRLTAGLQQTPRRVMSADRTPAASGAEVRK